jgi:hypothetical protein
MFRPFGYSFRGHIKNSDCDRPITAVYDSVYHPDGRRRGNTWWSLYKLTEYPLMDRLCGLVVRVHGYRSGGPGSIPGTNRKKK